MKKRILAFGLAFAALLLPGAIIGAKALFERTPIQTQAADPAVANVASYQAISEAGNATSWNLASASSSHTFFITLAVLSLGLAATGMMVVVYRRKKAHR